MSRWSPDARRRLQDAALDLFATHGYAETTVATVASHAGLTERTFFRHFEDNELDRAQDGQQQRRAAPAGADGPDSVCESATCGLRWGGPSEAQDRGCLEGRRLVSDANH